MTRLLAIALIVATPAVVSAQVCTRPKVLVLLDISGSMLEKSGGQTKYAQAKAGISAALNNLQGKGEFGLMVFPSTPQQTIPSGYCWTSSELAVPYAENNHQAIAAFLDDSQNAPKSSYDTPLYQALSNVAYLPEPPSIVLVISDGKQDCPGGTSYGDYDYDPDRSPNVRPGYGGFIQSEVTENRQDIADVSTYLAYNNVRLFAIGFSSGADTATLSTIAENAGTGRYYQANNTSELQNTLQDILYNTDPEVCDGKDNDCDGWIDEDSANQYSLDRECANGCGWAACVDGAYEACRQPSAEECNGFDDDCDGQIDNIADIVCAGGRKVCVEGQWVAQNAEVCDGKDNDCNGLIDDGIACACSPGQQLECGRAAVGICTPGTRTCQANAQWGECTGGQAPATETCNNVDDNCDGTVDNLDGACLACGQPGQWRCNAEGKPYCAPLNPGRDECNGEDDDCDGQVDEDGDERVRGECGDGVQRCVNGKLGAIAYDRLPEEVCDGRDNNCDGIKDPPGCGCEHGTTKTCDGACGAGIQRCLNGRWSECIGADNGTKEVCDGVDQNCNGIADEEATCDNPSESCLCGHCVPACKADGTCDNGGSCINGMCEIGGCTLAPVVESEQGSAVTTPKEAPLEKRITVKGGCGCNDTSDSGLIAYFIMGLMVAYFRHRRI